MRDVINVLALQLSNTPYDERVYNELFKLSQPHMLRLLKSFLSKNVRYLSVDELEFESIAYCVVFPDCIDGFVEGMDFLSRFKVFANYRWLTELRRQTSGKNKHNLNAVSLFKQLNDEDITILDTLADNSYTYEKLMSERKAEELVHLIDVYKLERPIDAKIIDVYFHSYKGQPAKERTDQIVEILRARYGNTYNATMRKEVNRAKKRFKKFIKEYGYE